MDIKNMLDGPSPKFCMGQKVIWTEADTKEYGVVIGMRYTSPLHRVVSRENFSFENLGWWYEVSKVEGRTLEDLAQNWEGAFPISEVKETDLEAIAPLTNAAPLDGACHAVTAG